MSDSRFARSLDGLDTVTRRIGTNIAWVCGVVLMLLALMIGVDVFLRTAFKEPLPAAPEISVLMLPWIVFPAFVCALLLGTHVRVSLFTEKLPQGVQSGLLIFRLLLGLALFSGLTWWSWLHFWESFQIMELMLAQISLPYWVGKLALPLGAFLIALGFLNMIVQDVSRLLIKSRKALAEDGGTATGV
ncbi:TRAP transporter small permease [Chloroflexota bacterium]